MWPWDKLVAHPVWIQMNEWLFGQSYRKDFLKMNHFECLRLLRWRQTHGDFRRLAERTVCRFPHRVCACVYLTTIDALKGATPFYCCMTRRWHCVRVRARVRVSKLGLSHFSFRILFFPNITFLNVHIFLTCLIYQIDVFFMDLFHFPTKITFQTLKCFYILFH